ncbi:MAG: hypothetical protein GY928_05970 [Colwellia sp.]|nr:hypothetical protein [Colwellia sp.]
MKDIIAVLLSPNKTMQSITQRKNAFWQVILFLFIMDIVVSILLMPYISLSVSQSIAENPNINPQQLPVIIGTTIVVSSFTPLFILAFVSMLITLAIMIFDGKVNYKSIFYVLALASIPAVIARISRTIFYLNGTTTNPRDSISSIGYHLSTTPEWQTLLNGIDILDLWTFLLVGIGIKFASGLKASHAYLISIFIWGGMQLVYLRAFVDGGVS